MQLKSSPLGELSQPCHLVAFCSSFDALSQNFFAACYRQAPGFGYECTNPSTYPSPGFRAPVCSARRGEAFLVIFI